VITRIIISGGGTGGHIFPAIAIAGALKRAYSGVELLFVGAEGRMEMEKVPAAGYPIVGLPVIGIERKIFSAKNLTAPGKLLTSLRRARAIIRDFSPHVVVGVGGYASAPTLWAAQRSGIPTLIQEQNSYAGLTNRLLARRAETVCVACEGMERFFPKEKIVFTGNPVRQDLSRAAGLRSAAVAHFGLKPGKKTILIAGGSLGARTLNEGVLRGLDAVESSAGVQLIWQTGERYRQELSAKLAKRACKNVALAGFIGRMDYAYAAADLVVSRAGASAIAELCVAHKPCILVPSPNVAEDHQTANAMALVRKNAALLLPDRQAVEQLIPLALQLANDEKKRKALALNIAAMAVENAAERIAKEVMLLGKMGKFV
jgi:UDP-N-acetylglucosamine--N-acetylmuramyl-(pentapeptide) pyrophosphoryl-undecaprenol N-acetylglucosamine transferase